MPDVGQLKPLSAFEWASVSQYIIYVSSVAGLKEFNSNDVSSFPLARIGPNNLTARKERLLTLLKGNKKSIERFVGARKEELGAPELSVLRSMYLQFKHSVETVEQHLEIARMYQELSGPGLLSTQGDEDELPF